jgi:hypothetical protein
MRKIVITSIPTELLNRSPAKEENFFFENGNLTAAPI